jgi:lipid II:glycine glycyltransferase (peptidoglycan interpeptide bridge formation enzyme)
MRELPQAYRPIGSMSSGKNGVDAWHTTEASDPLWDDFLRGTPCGQYQQSSLWAEFKKVEGWEHHRIVMTSASIITGGFQVLWKRKGPIRIGYVSKGPVLQPETPALLGELIRLLVLTTRELRLNALILQQPDETSVGMDPFTDAGFVVSNPTKVIEATCLVDLHQDMETLRSKMSSSLRGNVRTARKLPVMIRNGTEKDIGTFFSLMTATCHRQNTVPNPANEIAIRRLWEIFSRKGMIRLTLAECEGQVPAAIISLGFGDRLTAWKKGWNGGQKQWHPNELLQDESMEWAKAMDYRVYDFSSFSRVAAERILGGEPATSLKLSSRDLFHRRFGGRPKLMPRALVLIPNRFLRWLYRQTYIRFEFRSLSSGL